jgi:hypothetical protein
VDWPDLFTMSDSDRADIGVKTAQALATYVNAPGANSIVPEGVFVRRVLGFSEQDVDAALDELEQEALGLEDDSTPAPVPAAPPMPVPPAPAAPTPAPTPAADALPGAPGA